MKRYWIIALALILTACSGSGQQNFSDPTDRLEVVSWWVSPSEHPAFEVLLNAFKAENPTLKSSTAQSPVVVGAMSRWRSLPACGPAIPMCGRPSSAVPSRMGRRRPDRRCVRRVRTHGLGSTQQTLLDAATYRVKAWGVPTGSHRGNVLWFNQRVLRDAPSRLRPGYTGEAFGNDRPKWRQAVERRCVLAARRFTATELFENTRWG